VAKLYGDGAYDSGEVYRLLEAKGIEPVIKPRRNARLDTRPTPTTSPAKPTTRSPRVLGVEG